MHLHHDHQEEETEEQEQEECHKVSNTLHYIHLIDFFSKTTWVSRHQKDKPFWILIKQEMMGWQWYQLDYYYYYYYNNFMAFWVSRQPSVLRC